MALSAVVPLVLSPPVVAAVLLAAVLHATWNSIAHAIDDRLVGFALIGFADVLGGALLAGLGGLPPAGSWVFIVGSAAAHVGYNLLLMASYQLGEFSQAYPLARGTAPLVVTLVSLYLLDRPMQPAQLAGILVISAGLFFLVLAGGRPSRAQLPALGAAMATGLLIALYTVIDGVGVGRTPLLSYLGWMFLLQGVPLPLLAWARRRRELGKGIRQFGVRGTAGGFISLAAYSIVLWAQTSGALAPIAALRESSIVFGALIGALFLGERLGRRRALAAGVVLIGVLLISLA
jgi:drug/metabolite transporter (DMT)-like permease